MKRLAFSCALAAVVLISLSACGEKPQTLGSNKGNVGAFEGAHNLFVVPGWTPGDKNSWEQELKARTLRTQNEYSKMNTDKS